MSQSNMQGFDSDEIDEEHGSVFPEGRTASEYLATALPNDGDSMFFGYNKDTDEWVQLVNVGGRLWIEVGEGAA